MITWTSLIPVFCKRPCSQLTRKPTNKIQSLSRFLQSFAGLEEIVKSGIWKQIAISSKILKRLPRKVCVGTLNFLHFAPENSDFFKISFGPKVDSVAMFVCLYVCMIVMPSPCILLRGFIVKHQTPDHFPGLSLVSTIFNHFQLFSAVFNRFQRLSAVFKCSVLDLTFIFKKYINHHTMGHTSSKIFIFTRQPLQALFSSNLIILSKVPSFGHQPYSSYSPNTSYVPYHLVLKGHANP